MTRLTYGPFPMTRQRAERASDRIKLRPARTGCADLNKRHKWAHRILDVIAAGMDVKPGYADRALRILGDLSGAQA